MLRRFLAIAAAVLLLASPVFAQLKIEPFVTGLTVPIAFIQDPTDATVQYVVQQNGHIRVVKSGVLQATDFLDLSGSISGGGERGLLGLAFEPGDVTDRRFYVYYTNNTGGDIVIARFLRSTGNRLVADPLTFFPLQWPTGPAIPHHDAGNHNGGTLAFGPDGYLYIGVGDGGGGNDVFRNAQNPGTLLGKMLRIDVRVPLSNPKGYSIPADNPFLDNVPIPALGEIWSFGLRNPWKFSFDYPVNGGTGGILIGDVGQSSWEEIDYEPPNQGGRNYGWAFYEGAHPGDPGDTLAYPPATNPVFEYSHSDGISVSGGNVYRGAELGPAYAGRYFFGDLTGRVWSIALTIPPSGEATASNLIEHTSEFGGTSTLGNVVGFGLDSSAELYIVGYSKGTIFKVLSAAPILTIDNPPSGSSLTVPFGFWGWSIDRRATSGTGISTVHLWAFPTTGGSPVFLGAALYDRPRPDIGAIYGMQFTNSGYELLVTGLNPGSYVITAYGFSTVTGTFTIASSTLVTVRAPIPQPGMALDRPGSNSVTGRRILVSGWAVDLGAPAGTGADMVHVWAFPTSGAAAIFLGGATYGLSRPDVGAAFGNSRFTPSGFQLSRTIAPGNYTISAYMHSTVTNSFNALVSAANVTVLASFPTINIDNPVAASNLARPFGLWGWAVDTSATSGTGVDLVHVWAFPVTGAAPIFVGAATYGQPRPDIGGVLGSSQFNNCGYSLLVTPSNLPTPGTYDLYVYARSTVTGVFTPRTVRVTVN